MAYIALVDEDQNRSAVPYRPKDGYEKRVRGFDRLCH